MSTAKTQLSGLNTEDEMSVGYIASTTEVAPGQFTEVLVSPTTPLPVAVIGTVTVAESSNPLPVSLSTAPTTPVEPNQANTYAAYVSEVIPTSGGGDGYYLVVQGSNSKKAKIQQVTLGWNGPVGTGVDIFFVTQNAPPSGTATAQPIFKADSTQPTSTIGGVNSYSSAASTAPANFIGAAFGSMIISTTDRLVWTPPAYCKPPTLNSSSEYFGIYLGIGTPPSSSIQLRIEVTWTEE